MKNMQIIEVYKLDGNIEINKYNEYSKTFSKYEFLNIFEKICQNKYTQYLTYLNPSMSDHDDDDNEYLEKIIKIIRNNFLDKRSMIELLDFLISNQIIRNNINATARILFSDDERYLKALLELRQDVLEMPSYIKFVSKRLIENLMYEIRFNDDKIQNYNAQILTYRQIPTLFKYDTINYNDRYLRTLRHVNEKEIFIDVGCSFYAVVAATNTVLTKFAKRQKIKEIKKIDNRFVIIYDDDKNKNKYKEDKNKDKNTLKVER